MSKVQIIIVEDESIVALDLRRTLEDFGYEVPVVVASGKKAIEQVGRVQPDLVLMDIMLDGEMDGIEAAIQIQRRFNVPVVYLTANADENILQRAKITEPFGYLLKPFQGRELRITIEMALYKHRLELELKQHRDHLEEQVQERTAELVRSNEQLLKEIDRRQRAQELLQHNLFHDALTGLPNRIQFANHLERSIGHTKRSENYLAAVLLLDLDRFKIVIDSLGHTIGNQLLMTIAYRLRTCIRPGDTVARLGGDEFAILLDGIKDAGEAIRFADQIQKAVALPVNLHTESGDRQQIVTTVSIGIVLSRDTRSDLVYDHPTEFLRDADTAMYRAKGRGRARYEVFDLSMRAHAVATLELEAELRQALKRQEFQVYYQPIISLIDGRITGAEALLRWQHPQRGLLSPTGFIALLEETGLIVPVGEWLLRTTCAQIRAWHTAGHESIQVAVNTSIRQFQEQNFPALIKEVLAETGLAGEVLVVEVTESIAMQNVDFGMAKLDELSAIGVHIAIDDFGVGYSSLDRLKRMPIRTLKIDQSFVDGLAFDPDDPAIIKAIISMAHSLNLRVVAEGVETKEQLDFLRTHQCDEAQGLLFSPPAPAQALTKLLQRGAPLLPEPS